MATTKIKSTYSLDVETMRKLERMAQRLGISKSEALRRAIRSAARIELAPGEEEVDALDRLQRSLGLSKVAAREWEGAVRKERKASG